MRPMTEHAHESLRASFLRTPKTTVKLLTILLISASASLALYVRVASKSSALVKNSKGQVTVWAAGRGKPFLNLKDGRDMTVKYSGPSSLADALQNGSAQARTLASADFDRNGTPDIVAGYALNGAGMITLQRGNPDAFAPTDDSVFVRMQQGYDPDSLLPNADVYGVPASPDFLVTGDFNRDGVKDVLFAAKGGAALYLMTGNGAGRLGDPEQITLPGPVSALAAGDFRAADGFTDLAVGVTGPGGNELLIFDGASGFADPLVEQPLAEPASAIEFGGLDDDPFQDVAVTAGSELTVVHGWGRKENVVPSSRIEHVNVGAGLSGLAVGEFVWDRQGRSELAALALDGTVHIIQNSKLDTRPFTDAELAQRTRGKMRPRGESVDVESLPSWQPGKAAGWSESKTFTASSFTGVSSASSKPLIKTNL
ncbi:MAG TPA: VCBS repeat-containing protein, partial [Pyrinomonadaceae bacterium]